MKPEPTIIQAFTVLLESGNEEYVANPKAILALARALFRAGEFKNSIYYYDLYFKYKNSDDLWRLRGSSPILLCEITKRPITSSII